MPCPTCYRSAGLRYHRAALADARRHRRRLLPPMPPGAVLRSYEHAALRSFSAAALADAAEIRRTLVIISSARP